MPYILQMYEELLDRTFEMTKDVNQNFKKAGTLLNRAFFKQTFFWFAKQHETD